MAVKITWHEPTNNNVLKVEINRAATRNGSYSVLTSTYNATSDAAAKSSSNTWITYYIDASGAFSNWYKLRFYDNANTVWSDYSEPIAASQVIKLTSIEAVKGVIDTVGRFTDSEIFDAIEEIEEEIYIESGTPIKQVRSDIGQDGTGTIQDTYYVGEENVYRIDRVFYGTYSKTELYLDDGYKQNLQYGMIRLLPVASGGPALSLECTIEMRYVPKIFSRLALYRSCKYLLEKVDYGTKGKMSKELEVICKRLDMVESLASQKIGIMLSSGHENYDSSYGTNLVKVTQDFVRNRYIASTGWR